MIDERPAQRADLLRARDAAETKLANLVGAIENGNTSNTLLDAVTNREAEVKTLDAKLAALSQPIEQRMTIIPTWVRRQLKDAAGLIGQVPERAKAEFERLGINFVLHPVTDEGAPFLRAVGVGGFEHLAFSQYSVFPTTGASHQRAAGSRKFVVDLPANRLGPGRRGRAG